MDKATRSQLAGLLAGMDADELREAFDMVRDAFRSLERRHATAFAAGDCVQFRSRNGHVLKGTVEYPNDKTVTIKAEDGRKWRVSPSLLEKVA